MNEYPANWQDAARQVIRALIVQGEPFTTDEIWQILSDRQHPRPHEPRALGGIINGFVIRAEIYHNGYRRTTRPTAHYRPLSIWTPKKPPCFIR